jgi:phosphinothricin acetyltransferase
MRSEEDIVRLVGLFEACTLPAPEWTHEAHTTTALTYTRSLGHARALAKMRAAIQRYNASLGKDPALYHETVTCAWVAVIDDFLAREDKGQPLAELAAGFASATDRKDHLLRFYSRERLLSADARSQFVAPDLQPLPVASPRIRLATELDLEAIRAIYNHYVLTSTATFQVEPETSEERAAWFRAHGSAHPVTVLEEAGAIRAWGSLSRFNVRAAYGRTAESSVYVHRDHHRRGFGRRVVSDQITRAIALGHHTIIAGVSADQDGSLALHRELGFVDVACLRQVGHKFGRFIDVIYLQRMLG